MRHTHGHGVRSIDHLAYTSGMGGWNPAFKTMLAVGTLVLCLAADRPAESSAAIRARVVAARAVQAERFRGIGGVHTNAMMNPKMLREHTSSKRLWKAVSSSSTPSSGESTCRPSTSATCASSTSSAQPLSPIIRRQLRPSTCA